MADIRPNQLPDAVAFNADDKIIVDQNANGVRKAEPGPFINFIAPIASQSEAETGTDNNKRMTPLRTKQSIASQVGVTLASKVQGDKADTAVQTVNSKIGPSVILDKSDVGLGNVDNTSDMDKPVSTATQAAIDAVSAGSGFPDMISASSATIPTAVHAIELRGFNSESDGLGGQWTDDPLKGDGDTFESADGREWYRVKDVSSNRLDDITYNQLGSKFVRGDLVQKKVCELFFGFNNGITDTQIFPGAQNAIQDIAYVNVGGAKKIFAMSRPTGGSSNYTVNERCRIVQFPYATDGSVVNHDVFTNEINCGHGALLHPLTIAGELYFLTPISTVSGHEGAESGKGVQLIKWSGASTVAGTQYQLLPWLDVDSPLAEYGKGGWGVSSDGKVLIGMFSTTKDNSLWGIGWNLSEILATSGGDISSTVTPMFGPWHVKGMRYSENDAAQGLTADENYIYVCNGFGAPFGRHSLDVYDYSGALVSNGTLAGSAGDYGLDGLLDNPTIGFPNVQEFEGLSFGETTNELLFGELDTWVSTSGTSVVSYNGQNFAARRSGVLDTPLNQSDWVRTTKAAGGAYNPATSYTVGNVTRRSKPIYRISAERGEAGEVPIDQGYLFYRLPGCDLISAGNPDLVYKAGQTLQIKAFSEVQTTYKDAISYNGEYARFFADGTSSSAYVRAVSDASRSFASFGFSVGSGGINFYSAADSSAPSQVRIFNADNGYWQINNGANPTFRPGGNGIQNIGTASNRVATIYLTNNPDVSSDENLKTPLQAFTSDELNAAKELSRHISIYEMLNDLGGKRVGLSAQKVVQIMADNNLDANDYNMISCPNPDDEEGSEFYSLRYEQALAFCVRGLEARLTEAGL